MTRQFIKDAAYWCRRLEVSAKQLEETIITNDKKDITVFRIVFASGAEITALPSVEYSIRSKQGNVILDEAAFVEDFEGVKKAALALLIWGGRFSILSTHNGEDNPFNLFIKKIKSGAEKDWNLHFTTFDQAIAQGLYRKICEVQKRAWTREGEQSFVHTIYDIYKDNADEELRCIPRKAGTRYFSRLLLEGCTGDGCVIVRERFPDTFVHERKGKKKRRYKHSLRKRYGVRYGTSPALRISGLTLPAQGIYPFCGSVKKEKKDLKAVLFLNCATVPLTSSIFF